MSLKILRAIKEINPNAEVSIKNDDWSTLTFHNGTPEISQADIEAKMSAREYKEKRAAEYPTLAEQLDDIYHNGIDGWKATIKAIKDKYPKE